MGSGLKTLDLEKVARINQTCLRLLQDHENINEFQNLLKLITEATPGMLTFSTPAVLSVFSRVFKSFTNASQKKMKDRDKVVVVDTLKAILDKIKIDQSVVFFNIYGFLLFQIYDHNEHKVLSIDEEYKLSLTECTLTLAKSMTSSLISEVYVKENAPKFSQMMFVLIQLANTEKWHHLQIAAIEAIMALAQVLDDDNFDDLVLRSQVADVFLFFLPGIARHLQKIALSIETVNHKVPVSALKALGRLVTMLMQDYNAFDQKIRQTFNIKPKNSKFEVKFKDNSEVEDYIQNTGRTAEWYAESDKKLQSLVIPMLKITQHTHAQVRLALIEMVDIIVRNCVCTMPYSLSHLLEIAIALSEDPEQKVAEKSTTILEEVSKNFEVDEYKFLLDNSEEHFYNAIVSLPRKFNSVDESEKLVALSLIKGYLNLFGESTLRRVLLAQSHLNCFLLTFLQICEFDTSGLWILEDCFIPELERFSAAFNSSKPWKRFKHFLDEQICSKIESIFGLVAKLNVTQIIGEFLLDVISSKNAQRKEAIFLLNSVLVGTQPESADDMQFIYDRIEMYVSNINLPLAIQERETLSEIQNNVIQVCLLLEGLGKIGTTLGKEFQPFLVIVLYRILEKAGSAHYVVRTCGVQTLNEISMACGYNSVTDLLNENIDYFAFHVERKLRRKQETVGALDVLGVVMRYSNAGIMDSTCEIIKELLYHTNEHQKNANLLAHLRIFKIFISCLRKWLNLDEEMKTATEFKTRKQKDAEREGFCVSNIEPVDDFSDEIMGQTAEEMYAEDMEKSQQQLEAEMNPDITEYKKPDPPKHVVLTITLLTRSLHFLPSKNKDQKLLVLQILTDGVHILRNYEDELLPIVHQIWQPLVGRFGELNEPVIVNYSFRLLVVLSKLSKEFIRLRTCKEVLPNITTILKKLSKESYLKDRGAAYRYTQAFKLQLVMLEEMSEIVINLDLLPENTHDIMKCVFLYISSKQPLPLQTLALEFFSQVVKFDPESYGDKLKSLINENSKNSDYQKNSNYFCKLLENK